MSIRDAENELFARWAQGRSSFHRDGLVDEDRYERAPVRLLFLLKEVNEPPDGAFDLRTFLRDGGRPQSWDNVTRWTEGVFRRVLDPERDLPWSEFDADRITRQRRAAALRQVGAVNLKKSAGRHTTDNELFMRETAADAEFVREQLGLYRADLTICCGSVVARALDRLQDFGGTWSSTRRGVHYRPAGRLGVLVDYCHPEARVADNLLFYGLIDAVDELLQPRGP